MNITRLNFKESLPFILSTISQANFVALDLEMSGIVSSFTLDPSLTDSIQTRYHKTKCKAERFIPVQLGLCPFKYSQGKMIYSPFNIYLYPLTLTERDAEQFSFNSQSMRFLAKNNFDFNRLFYEGVPFLSYRRLKKHEISLQMLKKRQQQTKQYLLQSPDVAAFLNMKINEVVKWISIDNTENNQSTNSNEILIDIQFVRIRAYESLVYKIKQKYPSLALQFQYLDTNKNKLESKNFLARKYLKISKVRPQDISPQEQLTGRQKEKYENKLQLQQKQSESLMFNQIWQTIQSKRIPLVVHNGFLDLMHIYNRFVDDLPVNEATYRANIHKQFPIIYDTKYLCNSNPVIFNKLNKDTSLGNCYKTFRKLQLLAHSKPIQDNQFAYQTANKEQIVTSSKISQPCAQYKFDEEEHHEAGFDALMTAYTFVNAMKTLHNGPEKLMTPQFHTSCLYYSNKVPLGSIRVPYNFAGANQSYQQDGNKQFFFTCLAHKPITETAQTFISLQQELDNFFIKNFGPVRIIWQDKNLFNFILTFIKTEDESKFMKAVLDKSEFGLYNIGNDSKYLVSTQISRQKQIFTAERQKSGDKII